MAPIFPVWRKAAKLAGAVLLLLTPPQPAIAKAQAKVASPVSKAPIDYVNPFIGTDGEGNTFPGATLPFGFVQVSPDTADTKYSAGGYRFSKNIDGFSQQHISGMGGPLYGHVSIFPMSGELERPSEISSTGKSQEQASPGYYSVKLAPWDIKVELTATKHVGVHRHTFPGRAKSRVLVDAGHVLFGTGMNWGSAKPIGGEISVNHATREVSGFMTYRGARSALPTWKVFFVARFDTPFKTFGTWDDRAVLRDGSDRQDGKEIGAYLNFDTKPGTQVVSKIALSYQSLDQARNYLDEVPGFDFDRTLHAARSEWSKALGKIVVEGGTEDQRIQFYSALYRVHVSPNDWTGEAPARYGQRTYYENILCLWDTFRTVNPLLTLIQPEVQRDIVNTLINYYETDGWTGDAHSAWVYEHVQNGSNADIVIADAYVKGLSGIDFRKAYSAIRKNAFVDDNPRIEGRPTKGRFHLDDYRRYGFVPTDATSTYKQVQAVSRTLEYAYNDYAVHVLAKRFGTPEDIRDLARRQFSYRNVWDRNVGFMRGRQKDGSWYTPFNPSGNPLTDNKDVNQLTNRQYYEGTPWTWSWYVPHDTQGLVNLMGGRRRFVERLKMAVDQYYEPYNEPGMLQTYLFIHAGRPDLTQHYVREALSHFNSGVAGLPGNDDSGTTSAWLVWSMLGLYPNAGQDYYYVGSPVFTKATVTLDKGRRIVIEAPSSSKERRYVARAKLNGKPLERSWLRHSELINGANLHLVQSDRPSAWGSKVVPPSLTTN